MTVLATHRYEDRVSLLDMVERSLHLGVRTFGPRPVAAEVVESPGDATAEAYVTGTTQAGDAIRVHLELGFGAPATVTLSGFEAEWLGLTEGQIIPVRIDRWQGPR